MESYLREKKEAILEDRKIGGGENHQQHLKIILQKSHGNDVDNNNDDQKSCLQQVQDRYQGFRDEVNEDARSRRSHISKTASQVARSGAAQSLAGSAALLKQRLEQDFGIVQHNKDFDANSEVSGLEDEIDEWAALNKYDMLRAHRETQEKRVVARDRQVRMREELEKQQLEFRERQELFKLDQQKFAREQEARNQIQDEIDRKRREEKLRKIHEIKQWRLEHSKVRQEFYKSQREAQMK